MINNVEVLLPLSQLPNDAPGIGPKAANLAALLRAGFPVPDGLYLSGAVFDLALTSLREPIQAVLLAHDTARPEGVYQAVQQMAPWLEKLALPKQVLPDLEAALAERGWEDLPLAVRSVGRLEEGTRASLAGQHATFLGVRGREATTAVELDPEGSLRIATIGKEHQQSACLTKEWLARIAQFVLTAKALFGQPQDMEWAVSGKQVWILQSRPIASLPDEYQTEGGGSGRMV